MTTETHHVLKCWPDFFRAVETGEKTFEVRKNDRNFKVGDTVDLCEYDPERKRATGKCIAVLITYIFSDQDMVYDKDGFVAPVREGYCVWGFRTLPDPPGAPV